MQLLVADKHWLNKVSGGLPDTTLAVGGQEFSLRELDVAMFQMVKFDVAVLGRTIRSVASSLNASAAKLQECLDEGMPCGLSSGARWQQLHAGLHGGANVQDSAQRNGCGGLHI